MSGCNPDTIIRKDGHRHSLVCGHDPFFTPDGRVVYLEGDSFQENCSNSHTHKASLHLSAVFNRVARTEKEAATITENYVFIAEEGNAELRIPDRKSKSGYKVVGILMRL